MSMAKFPPRLIVPPSSQKEEGDQSNPPRSLNMFILVEKINYSEPDKKTLIMPKELEESYCLGSSHGWLILLTSINPHARILLFNPFTHKKIQLPEIETFPGIHSIKKTLENGKFQVEYEVSDSRSRFRPVSFFNQIQEVIPKVVLSADPSSINGGDFVVVIMYKTECKSRLLFYRHGGDQGYRFPGWTCIGNECDYNDIMCSMHKLCALRDGPSIDMWDLRDGKKTRIQFPCPNRLLTADHATFPSNLYSRQWYLVSSSGKGDDDIFLVVRYIGELVNHDGKVVMEADTLPEDDTQPLVCPYRTVWFHVYKLDFGFKTLVKVESLGDNAMFLGGNIQSVVVSAEEHPDCKGNVIYFTDDCWDRMHDDYMYGGHDMGVFYLEDGSIEPVFDCEIERIVPPPIWALSH